MSDLRTKPLPAPRTTAAAVRAHHLELTGCRRHPVDHATGRDCRRPQAFAFGSSIAPSACVGTLRIGLLGLSVGFPARMTAPDPLAAPCPVRPAGLVRW